MVIKSITRKAQFYSLFDYKIKKGVTDIFYSEAIFTNNPFTLPLPI
jgi:hypothetical protein